MTAVVAQQAVTSAAGVLSLLEEQENQLRIYALERLNEVVDQFWPEIADYLGDIEALYEDPGFSGRELAALVASKVFYHLEEYDDSLRLALGAGRLFDLGERSEYVEKIVAVAIDEYIKLRKENFDLESKKKDLVALDERLEDVVNRMFTRCSEDGAHKQGLGMAIDCCRLDKIKEFIMQSGDIDGMLEYCQKSTLPIINVKAFRERVLEVLIDIYTTTTSKTDSNYAALCQCHYALNHPAPVAQILKDLLGRDDKTGRLLAYQIAFDIVDNENQHFCNILMSNPLLKLKSEPVAVPETTPGATTDGAAAAAGEEGAATEPPPPAVAVAAPAPVEDEGPVLTDAEKEQLAQLRKILSGRASIDLHLEFLYRNNRSDLLLLETIKTSIDQRQSITHNGTVIAHGLMQCGTTSDVFLRKNLEWLSKASNWAKFTATASLGVIHKGHIKESKSILSTYLPQPGGQGSAYSEGGALYAMGLIHSNHYDIQTKTYLVDQLNQAQSSEVLQHGACLGIGLVCMATADEEIYEVLKQTLYTDTAVAGEAAAYAIGLVMVGSASEKAIGELLAYAHDTQHEKIIRACALALAMMCFRQEEQAETLIQQMLLDKDPILRYGACFCIAMAYVGTAQNAAIRRLLHISVSDVSDDVRRAAVTALGFVMCNQPEQLPGVVRLLSESYNPHVRYASAMALGIACAGSASKEVHDLLQPLMSDTSDFVRQGAIISLGLLYMQTSPAKCERVKEFRAQLSKTIGDKHEDVITRFGAILANGLLDAGGRNSCCSFYSHSGVLRGGAAIGFCLFTQMWYWYPLIHMLSLSMIPTALVGLNDKLKIPKNFSFKSNAKPSLFAYPDPLQPPKKEETAKTATAVLSTASKAKALKEKQGKEEKDKKGASASADVDMDEASSAKNGDTASVAATQGTTIAGSVAASDLASDMMDVDQDAAGVTIEPEKTAEADADGAKKEDKDEGKKIKADDEKGADAKESKKPEPEPNEETLNNPSRVLPAQQQYVSFLPKGDASEGNPGPRYVPLLANRKAGFIVLQDLRPDEPEDLFVDDDKVADDDEKEPEPPAPFEWVE